jgi:hypothetical protein
VSLTPETTPAGLRASTRYVLEQLAADGADRETLAQTALAMVCNAATSTTCYYPPATVRAIAAAARGFITELDGETACRHCGRRVPRQEATAGFRACEHCESVDRMHVRPT